MIELESVAAVASIATAIAATLSLPVLVWYTIETFRLRKEAKRQNELALRPLVVIEEPSGHERESFVIRNIGKGPALQVSPAMRTAYERTPSESLGSGIRVSLQGASLLAMGESACVRPFISAAADPLGVKLSAVSTLVDLVLTEKITETFAIDIYYESLNEVAYLTTFVATYTDIQRPFAIFYESTAETTKRSRE